MAAIQGKYGFHPCTWETYKKLKEINKALTKAKHQKAAWERWERKQPQNRVMRPKLRDSNGRVVGYMAPIPILEPYLCPIFCEKRIWPRQPWTKEEMVTINLVYADLEKYYSEARYPIPYEEACVCFSQSLIQMINEVYEKLPK